MDLGGLTEVQLNFVGGRLHTVSLSFLPKNNWGDLTMDVRLPTLLACTVLLVCGGAAHSAFAQTLTTIARFKAATTGNDPQGRLVAGPDGNLYGVTGAGGTESGGTVFQVTPSGVVKTIYDFCFQANCADGKAPVADLVVGNDGNLYGTTQNGGSSNRGVIFRLTTSGNNIAKLHDFCTTNGCPDGEYPATPLVQGTDGNFYGTSGSGGAYNQGSIYQITPSGAFNVIYSFCPASGCADGNFPGGLIAGPNNTLVGTTYFGGASGAGTVFQVTYSGALTTLATFCAEKYCSDGAYPSPYNSAELTLGSDGNYYGTASNGGFYGQGTIFKMTPDGHFATLYNFCGTTSCGDGSYPSKGLVAASDGNLYGTTSSTIFKVSPVDGDLTTLYTFCQNTCADGQYPNALMQLPNGTFYGTTDSGGDANNDGTVFKFTATSRLSVAMGAQVDYFGTGAADLTVFRPSTGYFYSLDSIGATIAKQWGLSTDIPLIGDFDGDGKTDIAVYRPSNGTWYVTQSSNTLVVAKQFGTSTDTPVIGDFDGDGKTDLAVFRQSTGYWYILMSSTNQMVETQFGASTDVPVVGDFDGDGKSDIAVFRPSTGYWYILGSNTNALIAKQWGASTDSPVPGDYDGDGKTDFAVFRPSTGYWYIVPSSGGATIVSQWGASTDMPVPRDYDGDGKTDLAVYRPSTGYWYYIESASKEQVGRQWGGAGDIPINTPKN